MKTVQLKAWLLGVAAAAVCASWAPAQALQVDLGDAGQYAGFFLEDVTGIQSIAGKLALAGNLSVSSTSIGAQAPNMPSAPSLVVGGSITSFTSGSIWSGSSPGFGEYMGSLSSTASKSLDLRKVGAIPVDFEADRVYLGTLSEQLRDLKATGTVAQGGSTLALTGSNQALEVFALTADQAASGLVVSLSNVRADAYLILNIASDSAQRLSVAIDTTALQPWAGRVLVNAYDAQRVQVGSTALRGSVLALKACICNSTGSIQGNVIARKWNSTASIGYAPFVPMP
jgi:choice-of-anchor A domain-containing protein